ncbi:MAG: peptidylprolyl isomerase [Deltaproteobacteria bacterium]|nr:peptidylprolyl isomerase [Deltaproteobacteria bacterium]
MLKKILPSLMAVFFLLPSSGARSEIVERIVALVNNEVITLSELEESGKRLFEQIQQGTLPSEREEKLKKARAEVLDQLIENKLLEQEIKNKKIEVPERDVDAAIEDIMKANRLTENELKMALAKEGMTFSLYRRHLREDLGKMRLINREIKSKIVIKEEDLRRHHRENSIRYSDPLEVKVQQIFFPVPNWATEEEISRLRQEAQSILERAQTGEDFAELASRYSKGPEAREGGVLGFFKPKELRPELEEVVFKMKPGEMSHVVRSPEGFHILRVLERKGGEPKSFAEVQTGIREEMVQAEAERQFQEWMKALKAKAYIEVRL